MLAGPHLYHCAWGPTPKRGRARFALTAAHGCRSLSPGDRTLAAEAYSRSKMPAAPMPPPTHMLTIP
jgi:hypothetical protein